MAVSPKPQPTSSTRSPSRTGSVGNTASECWVRPSTRTCLKRMNFGASTVLQKITKSLSSLFRAESLMASRSLSRKPRCLSNQKHSAACVVLLDRILREKWGSREGLVKSRLDSANEADLRQEPNRHRDVPSLGQQETFSVGLQRGIRRSGDLVRCSCSE